MIVAKPVIDNQYWILKQDDEKIGNVQAVDGGFALTIRNKVAKFKTIRMLRRQANIEFAEPEHVTPLPKDRVHGYPTGCRTHNGMWNVQLKLPLFTKTTKSKSWFAAGWYSIKQHRSWKVLQNPKLIVLERYAYQGPFYTEEQARDQSVS
jgi:hypothetical protein